MAFKLAVDAGHGGSNAQPGRYDPGAVGGGLQEADIALQWAMTGKHVLARAGIAYWLTREDDADPAPLWLRDERARANKCTHYLSLHCNAGPGHASGTEAFYRDANDAHWAEIVLGAVLPAVGLRNRGVKHESQSPRQRLSVLDFAGSATLLELGFITNSADRRRMTSRDVRLVFWQNLAEQIKLLDGGTA
jgi:N-acetylmuramoyl-L-alanine amidase